MTLENKDTLIELSNKIFQIINAISAMELTIEEMQVIFKNIKLRRAE